MNVPIIRLSVGDEEIAAVADVLRSGWLMQGPQVAAFEAEFAAFVGAPHASAVSSCTTAMHLGLLAAGVRQDDEVVTVSHSFIATANSVRYCGAVPVFVDIEPATFNIDPALVERAITPRTRAILCVHQLGMPCDVAALRVVADRYGLPLLEDAACAAGSEIEWNGQWERIGRPHGDIACFSFHPRKLLTTGDGGMITTANAEWDAKFKLWRHHGMTVSDTQRHRSSAVIHEQYLTIGYNYRLTDLQAAIGRVQLQKLSGIVEKRRELAARYSSLLAGIVSAPYEPEWARSNWQSYCVRLPDAVNQGIVMQRMLEAGIATRRGVMCAHREPAYAQERWACGNDPEVCGHAEGRCGRLHESELAEDTALVLPLFHQMSNDEQDHVVASLRHAIGR